MIRRSTISLKWWDATTLLTSLGILVILCWFVLIDMAQTMTGMKMDVQPMPWTVGDFTMMLAM